MTDATLYKPEIALAAADVTRDEVHQWRKAGWLVTPLGDDATGRARRYTLLNVREMAMFRALVRGEVKLSHDLAAEAVSFVLNTSYLAPIKTIFIPMNGEIVTVTPVEPMPRESGLVFDFVAVFKDVEHRLYAR